MIEVSKRKGKLVKHLPIETSKLRGRKTACPNVTCPASRLGSRLPVSACAKSCVFYKGFTFVSMFCSWMQGNVKPSLLSKLD